MIHQMNIYGHDKVEQAIERFRMYEPEEGYYLAFSGGKDSCVIKALADMAGVKYDAHFNHTSVEAPETIYFVRQHYPDVIIDYPRDADGNRITMWNLIPRKKMPPTRIARYCCEALKEGGGAKRFTVTGVRWAESAKRKTSRGGLEIPTRESGTRRRERTDPDNPDNSILARYCPTKGKKVLNPIIDWSNEEVWEFIHEYDIPINPLYKQGCKRVGCVGCPMNSQQQQELEKYPKFKELYINAFDRMLQNMDDAEGITWKTGQDVFDWWVKG